MKKSSAFVITSSNNNLPTIHGQLAEKHLHQDILNNVDDFTRNLSKATQRVLNLLFWASLRWKIISPSHSWIAKQVGYSARWVGKCLRDLKRLGVITWEENEYNGTNIYTLNGFFKDPYVWRRLSTCFNVFRKSIRDGITYSSKLSSSLFLQYKYKLSMSFITLYNISKNKGNKVAPESTLEPFSIGWRKVQKILLLTHAGMIRMSAFPDEVIYHVVSVFETNIKSKKIIGDYGNWLSKVANTYCIGLGIKPNWRYFKQLERRFGSTEEKKLTNWIVLKTDGRVIPQYNKPIGSVNSGTYKKYENEKSQKEDQSVVDRKLKEALVSTKVSSKAKMYLEMLLNPQLSR